MDVSQLPSCISWILACCRCESRGFFELPLRMSWISWQLPSQVSCIFCSSHSGCCRFLRVVVVRVVDLRWLLSQMNSRHSLFRLSWILGRCYRGCRGCLAVAVADVVDSWQLPSRVSWIPYYRHCGCHGFSGTCFTRKLLSRVSYISGNCRRPCPVFSVVAVCESRRFLLINIADVVDFLIIVVASVVDF